MNNSITSIPGAIGDDVGKVSLRRVAIAAAFAAAINLLLLWVGVIAGVSLAVAAPEPIRNYLKSLVL